jgi:Uma2 family endonuclease
MAPVSPADRVHTVESYFDLVRTGALDPDDRVELLEGVVVAMAPHSPAHASVVRQATRALAAAVGESAVISPQLPLVLRPRSAPEPDVAVLPGRNRDHAHAHPTTALLVVEVADSSLPQDRITKARLCAAAAIPELWIVNLRDGVVEVHRSPDADVAAYRERFVARRGSRLRLAALRSATVAVDDLLVDEAD